MATSSITRNFVISGKSKVEKFAKAVERSAKMPEQPFKVSARRITDPLEITELRQRKQK